MGAEGGVTESGGESGEREVVGRGASGSEEAWMMHPKHFFILSSSGRPMYSYPPDGGTGLASLTALITALASVVQDQVRDCAKFV